MTNAGDWLVASLIIIVIIMLILNDIRPLFKWRGKATKQVQPRLSVDTSKSIVESNHQIIMSFDSVTNFLMKLKRGWGVTFRFLFITSVGVIGYLWIDPQTIADIPFSQLTLNQISKNIIAFGIVLGCFRWFFSFPDMKDKDDPYNWWANFSGLLCGLVIVIGIIWGGWLG